MSLVMMVSLFPGFYIVIHGPNINIYMYIYIYIFIYLNEKLLWLYEIIRIPMYVVR